jgi:hypothetical protein
MTQAAILAASGSPGTTTGFKNKVINGNMVIDQRYAGASATIGSNGYFTIDRFKTICNGGGGYSIQQNQGSVTPPAGFTKYVGMTVTTTSAGSNYYALLQNIEGYNTADLGYGTANAKTITLSFWVRSSLTGTFGGALNNDSDRSYPFTYTISSANTWEQKSVTIAGDTSGTWSTTSSVGLQISFGLGSSGAYAGTAGSWQAGYLITATGATNVMATNGATLQFTGVQLEVGTTATNFDFRSYGTELALCQRYYQVVGGSGAPICNATGYSSTTTIGNIAFPVTMRTAPTGITTTGSFILYTAGSGYSVTSVQFDAASIYAIRILGTGTGYPTSNGFDLRTSGTATIGFNGAEL